MEQARAIVAAGRGTQFDPAVTDAFLDGFPDFVAIAEGHRNPLDLPLDVSLN